MMEVLNARRQTCQLHRLGENHLADLAAGIVMHFAQPLADAQATIAALQDTIIQMGGQAAVLAKDAMAAKEQIAALQAERDEYKTMYACLTGETYDNPIADLKAQLTQRTAELEAANTLLHKKNCALGRAETIINDLQAELERVRGERDKLQSEVDGWELGSRGFP